MSSGQTELAPPPTHSRRLREAGTGSNGVWSIGNEVYSVTLDPTLDPHDKLPLFGASYNFRLHGVVDLPEFLVHMPTLTIHTPSRHHYSHTITPSLSSHLHAITTLTPSRHHYSHTLTV